MWTFLVWIIAFIAVTSIFAGILVGSTLHRLAPDRVAQYCSSKQGIVGLGLGGGFASFITALVSLVFRLLLKIPLAPLWSSAVQVIAVTIVGMSGVYLGTWMAVQLFRNR
jgi:hypothetical protein